MGHFMFYGGQCRNGALWLKLCMFSAALEVFVSFDEEQKAHLIQVFT